MINTCPQCGLYRDDKSVDVRGQFVTCPECGHEHPFKILPLFIIGGPSGAGKSSVLLELLSRELSVVALEGDQLRGLSFGSGEAGHLEFLNTWLRLAKNVNQSGKPCAFFSAGAVIPHKIEPRVERRYFSAVHYLALVADDQTLRNRLLQRPAWRGTASEESIAGQIDYSHWLQTSQEAADYGITVLDSTSASVSETADEIEKWFERCLAS